jgi:hypothetical protein
MPLLQYVGFVGGALLLMLLGAHWVLPQPAEAPVRSAARPAIRISSVERLPERVVIDTSLPTIVPPDSAHKAIEPPPEQALVAVTPDLPQALSSNDNAISKEKLKLSKREHAKKSGTPRTAHQHEATRIPLPAAPVVRMSLIDIVRERLQHGLF